MRLRLYFDDPDYNEIITSVVKQVFPEINKEYSDASFVPILKEGIDIVKDMPMEDKGRFVMYMCDALLTSDKTPNIYRRIEKICLSTIGVKLVISKISIYRNRLEKANGRITIDINLDSIDYKTLMDKLFEIDAVEGTVLPILKIANVKSSIMNAVDGLIVRKTNIHFRNMSYDID